MSDLDGSQESSAIIHSSKCACISATVLFFLKTRCMPLLIHTALVLLVNHLGACIFLSLLSIQNLCYYRNRSYDGDWLSKEVLLDYDYMY